MDENEKLIFSFEALPKGRRLAVKLVLVTQDVSDYCDEAEFQIEVTYGSGPAVTQTITVNPATLEVTTSSLMGLDATSTCLLGCATATVVGRLLECADGDMRRYMKCLRDKGLTLTADVVKCATGCIFGAAAATSGP